MGSVNAELDSVRRLTAENRDQQADVGVLFELVQSKRQELEDGIRQRREAGFDAAQAVVITNRGKRTMDQMRRTVHRMEAREDALLAIRTDRAKAAYGNARWTGIVTTSVAALAVTALLFATRRIERERLRVIQAREDFLAIASHELRNPMNAVHLHVQGLRGALDRHAGLSPAVLRERLDRTAADVVRLTQLIDNLLDVSRMQAGPLQLEPERLELRQLAEEVVQQFRRGAAEPVTLESEAGTIVGEWDRLRLAQILTNLVSNAVKYGEGKPVRVALGADQKCAWIVVEDRGIGMTQEQQAKLFGRFARGVSRRQYGGFGLGLWITRQLVEAMGGQIRVTSEPGRGSTFEVELPLSRAAKA
jgi:signal transduction histidine kinase